jgi:hypothetical protein
MTTTTGGSAPSYSGGPAQNATEHADSTVRELVVALSALEDRYRCASAGERTDIARQLRAVVLELRRRRSEMRAPSRTQT